MAQLYWDEMAAAMQYAATTDLPVRERRVWFWANHFTISGRAGDYIREADPAPRHGPTIHGAAAAQRLARNRGRLARWRGAAETRRLGDDQASRPGAPPPVDAVAAATLGDLCSQSTRAAIKACSNPTEALATLFASPEFMRK